MFRKTTAILLASLFFSTVTENFASGGKLPPSACDLFSSEPVSYATPSPINVITSQAIKVHTNSSLILKNALFSPVTAENSGYALEGFGVFPALRNSITTFGGILCGNTYIFHKLLFYVSDDPKKSSFTQIDGKGSPLTLSIIYYKEQYGTFEESLKYRDGLVIQDYQIDFTEKDNLIFDFIELLIKYKLKEPGDHFSGPPFVAYAWFNRLITLTGYYAYYGSYIDLETGKQYPCAISILANKPIRVLSERQFKNSYLKMKNTKGETLVNRQPIQNSGNRPIYEAKGLGGLFPPF